MPKATTKLITAEIQVSQVLEELDNDDIRNEYFRRNIEILSLWEKLYTATAAGEKAEQDRIVRILLWEHLGRSV